jgi:DNA excision repair protein ERCC-2
MKQVLEEARRVIAYRDSELGVNAPKTLVLGMSSRRNLCIHPRVRLCLCCTCFDHFC